MLLDQQGYLHLTDFGIAQFDYTENSSHFSGTPGYMSPEVICKKDHNHAADYFAVGVITYECMLGSRPYLGSGRREIKEAIISRQV